MSKLTDDVIQKNPTVHSGAWTNGQYGFESDNLRAVGDEDKETHIYQGYGFDLSGYSIDKVVVKVEGYDYLDDPYWNWRRRVRVSWDGGTTWSAWEDVFASSTDYLDLIDFTVYTSWTPEKLSDTNFRVQIQVVKLPKEGCYDPDYYVQMFDETFKKIRDLQVGDIVLGYDSKKRKFVPNRILGIEFHEGRFSMIAFKSGYARNGKLFGSWVGTTLDHISRYFFEDIRKWRDVQAKDVLEWILGNFEKFKNREVGIFVNHTWEAIIEGEKRCILYPLRILDFKLYEKDEVVDVRSRYGHIFMKDKPQKGASRSPALVWEKK